MKSNKEILAVIGGGSIGISYLVQFLDEAMREKVTKNIEILLFEPQEVVGPGYAYQADFECNLLNTAAGTMSAKNSQKEHFIEWLKSNEDFWRVDYPNIKLETTTYLPRSLFGRYLNSTYQYFVKKTKEAGISFKHIKDYAIDIVQINEHQSCIDTERNGGFIVNQIAICLGNLPSDKFKEFDKINEYFNSPYPCRKLADSIPLNASVCVIGTSLSAIDTVLSLKESGHQGSIVCVSRNGRFPSVRGSFNKPHQLVKLTKECIDKITHQNNGILTLRAIADVFIEEYETITGEKCNLEEILNENTGMHDYISTEIKLSSSVERIWQSIIYATNGIIDYIWNKLSLEEKHKFNKYFRSQWLAYRVSFPLENAVKIYEHLRKDTLRIFGGIENITYSQDSKLFSIYTHDKRTGLRSIIQSEYLVNATSFSHDVNHCDIPLIKNLLKRGKAIPHEFGGFMVDYNTGVLIDNTGALIKNISVLGSLTVGVYLWTNAMEVNTRLAKQQASQFVKKLHENLIPKSFEAQSDLVSWPPLFPKAVNDYNPANLSIR